MTARERDARRRGGGIAARATAYGIPPPTGTGSPETKSAAERCNARRHEEEKT